MEYVIGISDDEAVSLLELGDDFKDEVKDVLREFKSVVKPEGSYMIYDSFQLQDNLFVVDDVEFHCGTKIVKALTGSECIAVVVATVGSGVDSLIKKYNGVYDFLKAYWCDKLSNWVLDKLMTYLINDIRDEAKERGMQVTSNWGPGYCGWNIKEQKNLLSLCDASCLGITLSSSMIMNPVKSISGVVGIGHNVVFKKSGCSDCNLHKCAYRSLKW